MRDEALVRLGRNVIEHNAWPVGKLDHQPDIPESDGEVDLFTHVERVDGRFVWQSPSGVGERLARTFLLLAEVADEGFSFHAAWFGATPDCEVNASAVELPALARSRASAG